VKLPRGLHPHRLRALNEREIARGRYVLYWMQQSQRAEYNHALEYAIAQANALGMPCLVGFALTDDYPEANLRHYHFMLQGLRETQRKLLARGVKMTVQRGGPPEVVLRLPPSSEAMAQACCARRGRRGARSGVRRHRAGRRGK
jgi:deoxyribodipyrimidine photo-lyase